MGIGGIMEKLMVVVVTVCLIVNSYLDLRRREVSLFAAAVIAVAGIANIIIGRNFEFPEMFFGILPGTACLLFAYMSNESIGYGDAWMLLALGVVSGGEKMLLLSVIAVTAAGLCAMILLVFFHKGTKYEIPFVPFLLLGFIWVRCVV